MHDIFESGGIFHQPDMDQLLNEGQATLFLNPLIHINYRYLTSSPTMTTGLVNGHVRSSSSSSDTSGLSISSSSAMTASPSAHSLNSVMSGQDTSSGIGSTASDEDETSSSSGSSSGVVYLTPIVKKPTMTYDPMKGNPMSSRLASFFGGCAPDIGIEASFAHGRELNRLVEIEEMNERNKKSSEIKFKKEAEEEKGDGSSQAHVEMDVLLGVLEEKKVSSGSTTAAAANDKTVMYAGQTSQVPKAMGKKFVGRMEAGEFEEWRKQFVKPFQDRSMSAGADTCKRKRSTSDEPELSTSEGKKRAKIEEL